MSIYPETYDEYCKQQDEVDAIFQRIYNQQEEDHKMEQIKEENHLKYNENE